ncbi:MAG: hypothetical protein ACE363_08030 [Alphaproteobacteria bacterium]
MRSSSLETKIAVPLLILRVTLGLFLLLWAVDKFIAPEHATAIFGHFYFIEDLPHFGAYVLGGLQTLLCIALIAGYKRAITYLIAFLVHGVSTVSTAKHIFLPWGFEGWNMLFMTGVPVLAAFWLLYAVREWDVLSLDGRATAPAAHTV